jgi:hypothetical protein
MLGKVVALSIFFVFVLGPAAYYLFALFDLGSGRRARRARKYVDARANHYLAAARNRYQEQRKSYREQLQSILTEIEK